MHWIPRGSTAHLEWLRAHQGHAATMVGNHCFIEPSTEESSETVEAIGCVQWRTLTYIWRQLKYIDIHWRTSKYIDVHGHTRTTSGDDSWRQCRRASLPTRKVWNTALTKGLVMVVRRRNTRGFTDPLRPCGPSMRSRQGPGLRLPKMLTVRLDAAARNVMGRLT